MEFDMSKENIQPLRGGRNITQLEVALQAQNDTELQQELMQQKIAFEEAIRIYEGDDPLDNWYNYIFWVEQSFPKHGHEGNLIPVLEDCLTKFENDERYIHDRRLCKLWIKYIDLQQNPLELFQLLHSKGICVSCADLYRAWAFYHEVAGDYKKADAVFKLGLQVRAQPFEELNYAYQNMFMAIGREAVEGIDERRREEERHALTSLVSYNLHQRTMVPSVRVGTNVLHPTPGVLPRTGRPEKNSNAPLTLYEDLEMAGPSIGAGASVSVLEIAKKQEVVHKENTLKPGTWKKNIITKKVPQPRQSTFKVHEDEDPAYAGGIRLPPDFSPMNFDDFSDWVTDLFYPEPQDDSKIPMYPKHLVYGTPNIEFSPEEIRAKKWFEKKQAEAKNDTCMSMQETMMEEANIITGNHNHQSEVEQAVHSILPPTNESTDNPSSYICRNNESVVIPRLSYFPLNISPYKDETPEKIHPVSEQFALQTRVAIYEDKPQEFHHTSSQYNLSQAQASQSASYYHVSENTSKLPKTSTSTSQIYSQHNSNNDTQAWTEDNASYQLAHSSVNNSKLPQASTSSEQIYPQYNLGTQLQVWTEDNARYHGQLAHTFVNNSKQASTSSEMYAQHNPDNNSQVWAKEHARISVNNSKKASTSSEIYSQHLDNHSQVWAEEHARTSVNNSKQASTSSEMYAQNNPDNHSQVRAKEHARTSVNNSKQASTSSEMYPQHNHSQVWAEKNARTSANNSKQASTSLEMYAHQNPDNHSQVWTEENARGLPIQQWPNNTINSDENFTQNMREAMKSVNDIWKGSFSVPQEPEIQQPVPKSKITKFQIHEDTTIALENKNSSSKLPFSVYDESENDNKRIPHPNLGPGGNPTMGYRKSARESLRAPLSSQPLPESEPELPRKTSSYSEPIDNFAHPAKVGFPIFEDDLTVSNINDSCTTQQFNFNLKSVQASTPFNNKKIPMQQHTNATSVFGDNQVETPKFVAKNLFDENKEDIKQQNTLSVILESTKEYGNSCSSSGNSSNSATSVNMLKTTTFYRESLKAIPEISHTQDESGMDEMQANPQNESLKEIDNPNINNYNMVKQWLISDSPTDDRKSIQLPNISLMKSFIDLTGDDSILPQKSVNHVSEIGAGDNNQNIQKAIINNYESPMKNQFKEMSCDSSNDSSNTTPVKGLKMDVDFNSPHSSCSELIMEQEPEQFDETILQKVPSDPFNHKLISALLRKIGFPNPKHSKGYIEMRNLPRIVLKKDITFLDKKYFVEKIVGKGAFGFVYKTINVSNGELVALKYQRPANKWEYYITKEIQERCNPYMVSAFMNVTACYISPSASVLASEFFKFGSLLDLANNVKTKTGKGLKEFPSIYYASEIITIVNTLHKCNIIHGDIKPDNFLVTRMPPELGYPSLQLIDFGKSIDMSLFPKGTTFKTVITTENFVCTEMKDGRPWTYQTDLFCIAATVHVLLFDKYMKLNKIGNVWQIAQHIPRYFQQDMWKTFFFQLLNIDSCEQLPDLDQIKSTFDLILSTHSEELLDDMRSVANSVLGR